MKKIAALLMALAMSAALAACGSTASSASQSQPESASEPTASSASTPASTEVSQPESEASEPVESGNGVMIAYFSWSGNTEAVANEIEAFIGGELVRIETATPYPDDYDELLDIASEEQESGARPALSTVVENMDEVDTIFIGYPNWWGGLPMPVASFLEGYDFEGKAIIPFCTHGGSRFGTSLDTIAQLAPGATLLEGFEVNGDNAESAGDDIAAWLEGLGYTA